MTREPRLHRLDGDALPPSNLALRDIELTRQVHGLFSAQVTKGDFQSLISGIPEHRK